MIVQRVEEFTMGRGLGWEADFDQVFDGVLCVAGAVQGRQDGAEHQAVLPPRQLGRVGAGGP